MIATIGRDGVLLHAGVRYRAAIGLGGIQTDKQEGDQGTPAGLMMLRRVLFRADRGPRPQATVPVSLLAPNDGWCDDPSDAAYNRMVRLPHPARHEALWRDDGVYDVIGVLGWNDDPPVKNRGSAIFLHLARPDYTPTEGCIALARPDLMAVLAAGITGIEVQP
jgi:L,D-peptidoglycan transpeptidase YkuD (ErfK/YbiS/YcfS/YnhG family)